MKLLGLCLVCTAFGLILIASATAYLDYDKPGTQIKRVTPSTPNPSYLAADPEGGYLYCVNELEALDGVPGSGVSAYAVDPSGRAGEI